MSFHKCVLTVLAVMSATSGLLLAQPAANTLEITFPPVGVALTETVQVNMWNQSANSSSGLGGAGCSGTVAFVNASGKTIAGSGGSFTGLLSGPIVSIALAGSSTGTGSGVRAEVRAVITLDQSVLQSAGCALVESLETFETISGETHVYLSQPVPPIPALIVPFWSHR